MSGRAPSPVDCPAKDGLPLRGLEMTRTETFTDAAFAFAVTLLVISWRSTSWSASTRGSSRG